MELSQCCEARNLTWKQSRVGERWSDILVCSACGHIHGMESWLVPIRYPGLEGCVSCAGGMVVVVGSRKGDAPTSRCETCGLSDPDARELHNRLAAVHPDRDFLQGALGASDEGRHVLALKLATAACRWGGGNVTMARTVRLQALDAIGMGEAALDEAAEWIRAGAPAVIWGVVADLEASTGNIEGAIRALHQGLEIEPDNTGMWTDLAELLSHIDERSHALRASKYGLADPEYRHRSLQVITDVAERYYDENQLFDAVEAMNFAAEHQERNVNIAWLQARIAASDDDTRRAIRWLEVTLALDPAHEEAKSALEKVRPTKSSWLPWR